MPAFFKKCPNCGKRFEVQHTGESVERKEEFVPKERTNFPVAAIAVAYPIPVPDPSGLTNEVRTEAIVEDDVYTETYRCKHCGHVWTEEREKVKELAEVGGAESDV